MENWVIISKFIVLCYCVLLFTTRHSGEATSFVLILLLYVSINMTAHIIKNNAYKRLLFLAAVLFLLIGVRYYDDLFVLLLPINIYELVFLSTQMLGLSFFINLLLLVLVSKTMIGEYFLVSGLTGTLFFLIYKNEKQWERLNCENDEMREKIHNLSGRLNRDREYERQIKYSSQLEERNKIAQEIHDRVGHTIAGSLMQLEAAKLLLKKDADKTESILQKTIINLREGMENIRAALRNIKPTSEQMGINRLKLLLDEFTAGNQAEARLFYTGDMEKINHASGGSSLKTSVKP